MQLILLASSAKAKTYCGTERILDAPVKTLTYKTQYPTRFQFPGTEDFIYVNQGFAEPSSDKPLVSEGFSRCIPIIVKNPSTNNFVLLHVDSLDINYRQEESIEELKTGDVRLQAIVVVGTETWHRVGIRQNFQRLGIDLLREINIETGRCHFGVGFDPLKNTVMVCRKVPKKEVLFFNGF